MTPPHHPTIFGRIGAQFAMVPWWAKVLLFAFYAVAFPAIFLAVRWGADLLVPSNRALVGWIDEAAGSFGLVALMTVVIGAPLGFLVWLSRRPRPHSP